MRVVVADWALILGLAAAGMLAVAAALAILLALPAGSVRESSIFLDRDEGTVFLFDGEVLVDASPGATALLNRAEGRGPPYARFLTVLAPHFPDLGAQLAALPLAGAISLTALPAQGTALALHAELRGGLTRVVVQDSGVDAGFAGPDPMLHRAMADEIDHLRRIAAQAPMPIWREKADGDIIWANGDYLNRVAERLAQNEDLTWPLPRLFEPGAADPRQKLVQSGGASWFDLASVPEGEGRIVYGLPADGVVQAEQALRDFMQTLTQTFAHLPIGLAIFDRNRQLHMFNPALLDLTGLPVDFLSLRPSLMSVLDALRDSKMLPEPKDYHGWRRQMLEMEKAAAAGLYEETWSLSGGQTYRVMARPHPNGGLAMMIEDISTETLRNRRYRAELELGHAVIDTMEEAAVIFGHDGRVVMANPSYVALWGHDPSSALSDLDYRALCGDWRAATAPAPVWGWVEAFVETSGDREGWQAEARLHDGRLLRCRFAALPGGATLAAFRVAEPAQAMRPAEDAPALEFRSRHQR